MNNELYEKMLEWFDRSYNNLKWAFELYPHDIKMKREKIEESLSEAVGVFHFIQLIDKTIPYETLGDNFRKFKKRLDTLL